MCCHNVTSIVVKFFFFQIPQILYSSLISGAIKGGIKYISLSEKKIIDLKQEKNITSFNVKAKQLFKILKIKFILSFFLIFILLSGFGYYISCFCGIYINTQLHLIKDSIISFTLSLITPFFIDLIPGIFRMIALKSKKRDKDCLYKFSKVIQILA